MSKETKTISITKKFFVKWFDFQEVEIVNNGSMVYTVPKTSEFYEHNIDLDSPDFVDTVEEARVRQRELLLQQKNKTVCEIDSKLKTLDEKIKKHPEVVIYTYLHDLVWFENGVPVDEEFTGADSLNLQKLIGSPENNWKSTTRLKPFKITNSTNGLMESIRILKTFEQDSPHLRQVLQKNQIGVYYDQTTNFNTTKTLVLYDSSVDSFDKFKEVMVKELNLKPLIQSKKTSI